MAPPEARAPRCAAPSIPNAAPDTTTQPRSASPAARVWAMCAPYGVQARAPTTETERSAQVRRFGLPRSHSPAGLSSPRSSSWVGHSADPGKTNRPPASAASARSRRGSASAARLRYPASRSGPTPDGVSGSAPGAVSSRISRTAPNSRSHRPPCASPGSSTRVSAARASSSASSEPVMSRLPAATSPRGRSRSAAPAPRPRPAPRADPVPAGRPRSRRRAAPGPARGR